MNYWWNCLTSNFANFDGRARRQEVWSFFLMNLLIAVVCSLLSYTIGLAGTVISVLYSLWALIPSFALFARRLHDTGRSGLWYFIVFVPIIGFIWFFVLVYCLDSQAGENKYGANPKGL